MALDRMTNLASISVRGKSRPTEILRFGAMNGLYRMPLFDT
jgi:hypothetical protein